MRTFLADQIGDGLVVDEKLVGWHESAGNTWNKALREYARKRRGELQADLILLTPWEAIEKRLEAAASADFVTALYNPKSARRDWQIVKAQEIFLKHRLPSTPVGLVKSGFREGEIVVKTTLDQMADQEIGMLTTVIIGNSQTYYFDSLMVTPRGYRGKYDLQNKGGDLKRFTEKAA